MSRILVSISLAALLGLSACNPFKDPIKLDPIKLDPIDIKIRMDVYQHSSDKVGDGKKDDDEAKSARERIYNRQQQIQEIKNNRWVVETHRGELQIREKPAGDNGAWVEKAVAEENQDRKILMRLRAKELNIDLHDVQNQFGKDNVEKAYKGEWIEVPDPDRPKLFKQTPKS